MVKFEDSLISNKQAVENMVIISITEFLRCLPITPYSIKVLEMMICIDTVTIKIQ